MKFLKAQPFEKHFEESCPDHLSQLYLLVIPDPFEREFLAQRMVRSINREHTHLDVDTLLEEIESPSLFSQKRVLICDNIEKIKSKTLPLSSDLILIVMGKSEPPFFEALKKEAVTLDLTEEKPWERKSRLQRWLLESARSKGKILEADVVAYLLEFGHTDFALLLQELEKVIIYSGSKKQISLAMVKDITSLSPTQTGWQLSEALVWGGSLNHRSIKELEDLHTLVGQIRYQLNLGIFLILGDKPPKLSPKRTEKLKVLAYVYTLSYFVNGLKDLFELELKMRSNITNHTLLLEYFYAKLSERRHALSST